MERRKFNVFGYYVTNSVQITNNFYYFWRKYENIN